jgi:hypothetical protein
MQRNAGRAMVSQACGSKNNGKLATAARKTALIRAMQRTLA